MATASSLSPSYRAFHHWLARHRREIRAAPHKTVIYSGSFSQGPAVWQRLQNYEKLLSRLRGSKIGWEPIETVLRGIPCTLARHGDGELLPEALTRFKTMWHFACDAPRQGLVTRHEEQQVWRNLSAWYAKNAVGEVFMFKGPVLKQYPDMLLAEIPVLAKNGNVTPDFQRRIEQLMPETRSLWAKYRADTPQARTAGR